MKKTILTLLLLTLISCKNPQKPSIRNNYNQIGKQRELQLIKNKINAYAAYGKINYDIKFEKNVELLQQEGFDVDCVIFDEYCTIGWN